MISQRADTAIHGPSRCKALYLGLGFVLIQYCLPATLGKQLHVFHRQS